VSKSFRTESITKHKLTFGITRWEATQRFMATEFNRLTHKLAPSGRELCHFQSSLQVVSPETFGYTLINKFQDVKIVAEKALTQNNAVSMRLLEAYFQDSRNLFWCSFRFYLTQNIYIYIYIYTYNSEFIKQKMYVTVQCVFGRSVLSRASMALLEEAESILFITVKQLINSKMTVLNCDYNYSFFCYHHHHHHHHQLHSLDPIGPFWLINLVWPNLHWSSKTSVSLWMALPSLFKYSLIFISS